MDNDTYDQVNLNESMVDNPGLLKEGDTVEVLFNTKDDSPLTLDMAPQVILQVTYTEPGVRGDTATNVTKPATVETGAIIKVPIFINEGDFIKIDTATNAYLERVKK